jgi:CPA2 family monovalent cation:H+ antiporter-2
MHGSPAFVEDLAVVLCVAALISVLFRVLRQNVVLGYLAAGLLVGPYVPIPVFADPERIHALSQLGVILVMFGIGLEFSIAKLVSALPRAGVTALIQLGAMTWIGIAIGRLLGWSAVESVFLGAALSISSTMVVVRAFAERSVERRVQRLVLSVLVLQDLAAILLLAALTTVASGSGLESEGLGRTALRLVGFLVAFVAIGLALVPRMFRAIHRLANEETLLVAAVGLGFALALAAERAGFSLALGAFLAGSLVAGSGHARRIEALVRPVRDIFAAVFFVAIGMIVDPAAVLAVLPLALLLSLVVVLGQLLTVSLGAVLSGQGLRRSVVAGLSLGQIGEFSFIIAAIGHEAGIVGETFFPTIVATAMITTFATPHLVGAADRIASRIEHALPGRVQTAVSLYGSWLEQMRTRRGKRPRLRRILIALVLDVTLVIAIVVLAASLEREAAQALTRLIGLPEAIADVAVWIFAAVLCVPFVLGIVRLVNALGSLLAFAALPEAAAGATDLAAAPRRVLLVLLRIGLALAIALPLLAITQPFLPPGLGAPVLLATLGVLAVALWRRAADLEGHVRAGAEVVVEALLHQGGGGEATGEMVGAGSRIDDAAELLPGIGELAQVTIAEGSPACGRTLAQLDVRGKTGATVLAIRRGEGGILVPTGAEPLQAGDVLALAGGHDAVAGAVRLLSQASGRHGQ